MLGSEPIAPVGAGDISESLRALLIDDNPDDRALVIRELRREFSPLAAQEVCDRPTLAAALDAPPVDLVITDFHLHWTDGLCVLRSVKARWPDCPVIMFTGTGSEEIAVEAMKAGLDDYVLKAPHHYARLAAAAKLALKIGQQKRQLRKAEARYGELFDSVPVGLYRATPQGKLLDANPALAEMLHYANATALLAVNMADLYINPMDYADWKSRMESEGVVHRHAAPLRTFEGGVCSAENSARSVVEPGSGRVTYKGTLEDVTERKKTETERERLITELKDALATVKALSGLLPICAACKKIRDDAGAWHPIESFIQSHSDAEFTHSFCPECLERLYPDVFDEGGTS